jgi:hypothetical protein
MNYKVKIVIWALVCSGGMTIGNAMNQKKKSFGEQG